LSSSLTALVSGGGPLPSELSRPARLAWLLFIVASWMLLHLYGGLRHDSVMYSMQGLAHAHPQLWAQDVYLRFGSQDQYTIFASVYGKLIGWLGLEQAAELLTALGELAFFVSAWRLARLLLPERQALMGLFLLVALPGNYGSSAVFHVVEDFVTPRLLAEALALATVLNWVRGRRLLAVLCATAGLAIHPIMSVAGIGICFWLSLILPRPRVGVALGLVCLAGLLLAGLASGPPLRFDDFWFEVSPAKLDYLLISHWDVRAWSETLVPLIMLLAGSTLIESQPARGLAQAALGTGIVGLWVSMVGGDLLHLVLIVQAQPWRCLWLSNAIAILLLPLITQRLWQRNLLGRATILLILAEYVLIGEPYSAYLAALTLAVLGLALRSGVRTMPANYQRLALGGAALLLAVALSLSLSDRLLPTHYSHFPHQQFSAPLWVEQVLEAAAGGWPAIMLLLVFAWALAPRAARSIALILALGCAAACCVLAPLTWHAWTQITYQPADKALFASWRAQVPPGTEVLYPENPLLEWIMLERPSYLSSSQATSALFSRSAAMLMYGRTEVLRPYLRAIGQSFWEADKGSHPTSKPTLAMACASSDLQFVMLRDSLDVPPVAEVSPAAKPVYRGLKLYQCPHAAS